jgi:hypothetical protein
MNIYVEERYKIIQDGTVHSRRVSVILVRDISEKVEER